MTGLDILILIKNERRLCGEWRHFQGGTLDAEDKTCIQKAQYTAQTLWAINRFKTNVEGDNKINR